jgi:hypothetical protein
MPRGVAASTVDKKWSGIDVHGLTESDALAIDALMPIVT